MPPERRTGPSYMRGGVVACPKRRHASLGCGPPHGWRRQRHLEGETAATGLHGVDLAVGLARMLLLGVTLGLPDTTGWRGPLVKARLWEVKGLDLVVNRSRVRRDGGPGGGGSNATEASYRALIHAGWCCGMSEEAARISGVWPHHGRRRRRHLEGGNGRVWSTWSGFSCGFGPDVASRCPSGPTRHNRVERSTGQSPSVQSQRARSRGQTLQG